VLQRDFERTAIDALKGLGDIRLTALRRDRERHQHLVLGLGREFLELFSCRLKP